uniref:DMAP1-binding domain-containing protein n=2 Tax=Timema TaxID=61471 RepID=A0A7R8Z676_TIMDO|nr:unnamed protein product [Timema douglasi]
MAEFNIDISKLPEDVRDKLAELDLELSEGDITQKGYEKKCTRLLGPFVPKQAQAPTQNRQQSRARRTQRRVTHNEKRYHSGRASYLSHHCLVPAWSHYRTCSHCGTSLVIVLYLPGHVIAAVDHPGVLMEALLSKILGNMSLNTTLGSLTCLIPTLGIHPCGYPARPRSSVPGTTSPASRAKRRGNRRLTRNESRYHSGEFSLACCVVWVAGGLLGVSLGSLVFLEVRQEAVQQALAAMQSRPKPSLPMPSKRTSVMAKSPDREPHDSASSSDEDSLVNEGDVQSTPERERARTTGGPHSDTSSTERSTPPRHIHHPAANRLNNGPGVLSPWEERESGERKRVTKQEMTDLADVMHNLRPCEYSTDFDLVSTAQTFDLTFDLVSTTQTFDLVSTTQTFDLVSTTQTFDLVNTTQTFDLVNTTQAFDLVSTTQTFELVSTTQTFEIVNTTQAFDLVSTTQTFDLVNTTQAFDLVSTTQTFDLVNTTQAFDLVSTAQTFELVSTTQTFDLVNTTQAFDLAFDLVNMTQAFDLVSTTQTFDLVSTTQTFDLVSKTHTFDLVSTTQTFDLVNMTQTFDLAFDLVNTTQAFDLVSTTQTFDLVSMTQTFDLVSTTQTFDLVSSTQTFDLVNTTHSTFDVTSVCTVADTQCDVTNLCTVSDTQCDVTSVCTVADTQPPDVTHNTAQSRRLTAADRVNRFNQSRQSSTSDDNMGTGRWKVSAKIQQLLNTLKRPKRRPLPEFYEDDDIELEIAANPKDPNAPKPEGSSMTPAVGEQLVVPSGLPRNLEAAIQRYGSATYKAPVATVLDPNGKLSITLTYGKLLSRSQKIAYTLLNKAFIKGGETCLKSGDRIALVYPNNDPINFICALYGCLQAGIVPVPIEVPLTRRDAGSQQIGFLLGSCGVQVALTSEACLKGLPKTAAGEVVAFKGWPKLHWFVTEHLAKTPKDWLPPPRLTDDTPAYIEYTTDRDGSVMGVTMTRAAMLAHCRTLTMACNYTEGENMVCVLDFKREVGLWHSALTSVLNGMHVVFIPYALMKVNPASWMQMITKYRGIFLPPNIDNTSNISPGTKVDPPPNTSDISPNTEVDFPPNICNTSNISPGKKVDLNTSDISPDRDVDPPNTRDISPVTEVDPPPNTKDISPDREVDPPNNDNTRNISSASVAVVKSRDLHWGLLATKDHKEVSLSSLRLLLVADGANPWSLSSCDQFLSVFQAKGLRPDAICPCASSSEVLTVSVRRPGRAGVNATGRGVLSMSGLSYGVVRVDQENSLTSLTLQDCGQVMPGCMIVVVRMEGSSYLCKTDEVGEICINSGATGSQYWGLQGLTNNSFRVIPLQSDGKPLGELEFVRSGLLGFLGPGGLVFVCGSRDGLMTVTGRKHNADDIIATVLAVEPMKFIYRGRIAVFSIRVLRDERICVIAEQRPDCGEEESFQWMSRVLQAVDSIHQVGIYCLALVPPNYLPKTPLGGIHLSETKRRFMEGTLHPANVLLCPHTCVTNLPKPREIHSATTSVTDVGPASVMVGNIVQGNRLASAQGRDMGIVDEESDSARKYQFISEILRWRAQSTADHVIFTLLNAKGTVATVLSCSQLHKRAERVGNLLQDKGRINTGDHVALIFPPGIDLVCAFYGCLYVGAVPVTIRPPHPQNLQTTLPTVRMIVDVSKSVLVLSNMNVIKLLKSKEASNVVDIKSWPLTLDTDDMTKKKIPVMYRAPTAEMLAYLDFSVSTTGMLAGIKMSHAAVTSLCRSMKLACELYPSRHIALCLDPYCGLGFALWCLSSIYSGHHSILIPPSEVEVNPGLWLTAVSQYRVRDTFCSYGVMELCTKGLGSSVNQLKQRGVNLGCVRTCVVVAEERPRITLTTSFSKLFSALGLSPRAVSTSFGCRVNVAICLQGASSPEPSTVYVDLRALRNDRVSLVERGSPHSLCLMESGKLLPGVKVIIANPETKGQCGDSHLGEIWVQSSHNASGYFTIYGDESDYADHFSARLVTGNTGEVYARTGYLGFLRRTESTAHQGATELGTGEEGDNISLLSRASAPLVSGDPSSTTELHDAVFVVGALDETVMLRGMRYHPIDIENSVLRCHKKIAECAVFTWTNLLVVVVELDGNENEALDLVPLVTNTVLEEHHLIVGVVVVVDPGVVPINSRGEKQRMHLRDGFLADQLDPIYVAYNMNYIVLSPLCRELHRVASPVPGTTSCSLPCAGSYIV